MERSTLLERRKTDIINGNLLAQKKVNAVVWEPSGPGPDPRRLAFLFCFQPLNPQARHRKPSPRQDSFLEFYLPTVPRAGDLQNTKVQDNT